MKRSLVSFPLCLFALVAVLTTVPLLKAQHAPPSSTWTKPSLSTRPSGRCCSAMAFDWKMQETLLFGGFTPNVMYNDTWVWRNGWSQLNPVSAPSPRQGPWMVWDTAAGNIVLFGGTDSAGNYLNDTWIWDGANWIQQFPPVSPPGRRFDTQGMTYDAAIQRVMLFGGLDSTGYLGDTWTWDGIAKTWTQNFPATSPSPRRTMLAYD
jgi:hypothetical protein